MPPGGTVIQSWDTASTERLTSDFSVCVTSRFVKGKHYIIDVFRQRLEFHKLFSWVIELARLHKPERLLIEAASSGTQLIQMLRQDYSDKALWAIACKPDTDKVVRFAAQASRIERGEMLLPREAPWLAEFITEILGFPNTRYDDQADALAQLLRHPPQSSEISSIGVGMVLGPENYRPNFD